VVSATIDRYVVGRLESEENYSLYGHTRPGNPDGIRVEYRSDLPAGSGLGTSSALNVAWLSLINQQVTTDDDRARIAELAYQLEEMLGILGGKQDQYSAAFGGINSMTFGETVAVERLDVSPELVAALESRLVLCYTGKPRLSSAIHDIVWGAFRRGAPGTLNALYGIRDCAQRMRQALLSADMCAFAEILNENWRLQKALDPSVTNDQIDGLFEAAVASGAAAGKACGAGGGGCLLFLAEEGRHTEVSDAVAAAGSQVISFRLDFDGLVVTRS
jgi:D-glycero-alpha-D-manno-heptose-7-phosphate kinase